MYKPVDPKVNFPEMEEEVLAFWKAKQIFEKSLQQRDGAEEFVFYDGPPFATGLPHFGHFVPNTVKDIIPRYQTMRGRRVERRFGWDCHGLPVEYEMEKELGISGKRQIEEFGVAKFNESCRSIVLRYTKEWETVITRLGRWVDFEHDYKTMESDYMESIWWVVKQLWEKELLFEGHYILPYCPRCSTVLSNHELNLGGYKEVHDPAITVRFELKDQPGTYIIAWTTTPWTLPSNLGLAVGADIDYVKVQDGSEYYILAKERLGAYYKDTENCIISSEMKGSELKGLEYNPLFPYFKDAADKGAFRVQTADFVSTEDGTGIVHIAPGFGEDDYNVFKGTSVPTVCPVDGECRFTDEVSDYSGRFVKEADKDIIARLKAEGKLVKRDQYLHNYPHCWRCDSPLIYRAISSWFVDISKVKPAMLASNSQVYWMPGHLKEGRFGKWLENARDWAISRNRYWGNPIPIWKCDSCKHIHCIGSRAELEELTGKKVDDLHKHFVDDLTYSCSCGGTMHRIPEVLDCWFESGAMPYAQSHYPFENKELFESRFPANFISEGLDQTRGWFYTLTILGAALFDSPAFRNVLVNGLVLAEDGKKMSKSLRNYTDPMKVINTYGADALRLLLMHSSVIRADDLKYSDDAVRDVLKSIIIPVWNAYSFFVTYSNIDNASPTSAPENPANPLDKWILSESERMTAQVIEQMEKLDMQKSIDPIVEFIDLLNNWYIRRSRRRFWRSENDSDKVEGYQTLWSVLMRLITVAAPFIPFTTEHIYLNLRTSDMPESVHLCDFPTEKTEIRDLPLERKMAVARKAVSLGRALRSTYNIKNRQPLKAIHLVTKNTEEKAILREMVDLIREELNVKEVVFRENEEELVEYSAKANFRVLGKTLGKDMKTAADKIASLTASEIHSLMEGAVLSLEAGDTTFDLTLEGLIVNRNEKDNLKVINEDSLTVALDPEITEDLKQEGLIRDLVRGIQSLRKDSGLDVTDRIDLVLDANETILNAVEAFSDHLLNETLANTIDWKRGLAGTVIDCSGETCTVLITKV